MKFLPNFKPSQEQRRADFYKALLHYEAKLGGELFGPIPAANRREFFCLDEHTWVWHEEWKDAHGQRRVLTTRYDIRPSGILKSQGGQHYQALDGAETRNICSAIRLYIQQMRVELPKLVSAA